MTFARLTVLSVVAICMIGGCAAPQENSDPAARALKDPMNYKAINDERYDVSGGSILELDRKSLGKDMSNVLSP